MFILNLFCDFVNFLLFLVSFKNTSFRAAIVIIAMIGFSLSLFCFFPKYICSDFRRLILGGVYVEDSSRSCVANDKNGPCNQKDKEHVLHVDI
jgi:hypothetical protein